MKLVLSTLVLTTTAALAQVPCLRGGSDEYNARPISLHDVLAKNAFGADHRAWRVATTCIHVDRTASIGLHAMTRCLAQGDAVSTTTIDGHREVCRVISVVPVGDDYAAAKYKD